MLGDQVLHVLCVWSFKTGCSVFDSVNQHVEIKKKYIGMAVNMYESGRMRQSATYLSLSLQNKHIYEMQNEFNNVVVHIL